METRDEPAQAQQGEGEPPAEPGQAVAVPAADPGAVPLDGHAGAAAGDPALLAQVGAALGAAGTQTVAGPVQGSGEATVAGVGPGLGGAPLPPATAEPQPSVAGQAAPSTVPGGDATASPTVAQTSEPTTTDADQGVPAAEATTTVGPLDVTVLDGATPLRGDTGAGSHPEGGARQDQGAEPPGVVLGPADDAVGAGGDVAGPTAPASAPSPRAEAALH
ncbi:MAG: hypothetical protein M3P95_07755, partial [Actinomycetota bacterium]|nr:hypothetical protein [Actinomycetota bacterium]